MEFEVRRRQLDKQIKEEQEKDSQAVLCGKKKKKKKKKSQKTEPSEEPLMIWAQIPKLKFLV